MSTLQVEVTIAAFLMTPAGHVLGDSIVSATVGRRTTLTARGLAISDGMRRARAARA